jgi:serine/threonine-protein kinase
MGDLKSGRPAKPTASRRPPAARFGEGTTVAGRFRLVRQIGEGGMGSVWLASHLGLGIPCAVKFVEGEWRRQPEMVARFEREAKVEAQLRSPHVVHVLDHGVWNGTPYIAMEYLEGDSLAQRLERTRRMNFPATHRLVAHVARALTRAHAIGIVHRDLKPENVFLVPGDEGEVAKVLDFGVAKWSSDWAVDNVTKTGLLVGTPLYMSPEQARGTKQIDFRADLWSLAVITYQCLTGHLPFVSDGLGDLLAKIMFEPIPMPSVVLSTLPQEFDHWWTRAASRDPNQRFQSAKELADTLAVALRIPNPIAVADVPPGFREAAFSDYGLSVSDGAIARDVPMFGSQSIWPGGPFGKLLGVGIGGVVLIAVMVQMQATRRAREAAAASAPIVLAPPPPTGSIASSPAPTIRSVEDLAPEVDEPLQPASPGDNARAAPVASAKSKSTGSQRPTPARPRDKSTPSPNKPKQAVDFGI